MISVLKKIKILIGIGTMMIAIPIFDRNDNANRGSNGNHQTKTK